MLPPKKRLLDQVRDRLRLKNYAYRTEKSYLYWIKQYILFRSIEIASAQACPEFTKDRSQWHSLKVWTIKSPNAFVLERD
jgi:hypothetical protein